MKRTLSVLCLISGITAVAGVAGAVDVQPAPVEQRSIAATEGEKQSPNVGRRDLEKEKEHGVGMNLFVAKNLAVNSSVSLLPSEQSLQTGQPVAGGLGVGGAQLSGAVGLKLFFN